MDKGQNKKILFCSDFSENADYAFTFAVEAALSSPGSVLFLLHVLPEPDAQFWKGYIYDSEGDPDAKAKADIDARIARSYASKLPKGVEFEKVFRIGRANEQILAVAEDIEADLIVIGRQGKGAMRSLFFGDIAARVVKKSRCPILVVPSREG